MIFDRLGIQWSKLPLLLLLASSFLFKAAIDDDFWCNENHDRFFELEEDEGFETVGFVSEELDRARGEARTEKTSEANDRANDWEDR